MKYYVPKLPLLFGVIKAWTFLSCGIYALGSSVYTFLSSAGCVSWFFKVSCKTFSCAIHTPNFFHFRHMNDTRYMQLLESYSEI